MKKILFFSLVLVFSLNQLFSQVPQAFKYQAVVRNNGQIIANKSVSVLVKILQNNTQGALVYSELQTPGSNEYGVINLSIGDGNVQSGNFSAIDWSKGTFFMETDIDINGGTNYQISGSVQLLSVPYALFANKTRKSDQFEIGGTDAISPDSALFVVKDKNGQPVFSVYETGVEVSYNVKTSSKGAKSGFSVGGRNPGKGALQNIFELSTDSIRMYVDTTSTKGARGGFSVGGRGGSKGSDNEYFSITGSRSLQIVSPSQSRIYWYPRKEAFLTGRVLVESPDSVGTNSTATGFESKAIGNWSQALGYKTIARNNYSTAIGKNALASGLNSFAFGDGAKALNDDAYAFGAMTEARGRGSFAFGYVGRDSLGPTGHVTSALGDWSFAFGLGSKAVNNGDFAFGVETKASGGFSSALGFQTMAKGWDAFAIGDSTVASGTVSTAMGYKTVASGWVSFAINQENEASGGQSFAGGLYSKATDGGCFAFGFGNIASKWLSVAFGDHTVASGAKAFAGGWKSIASGDQSFSFGDSTSAAGLASFSVGERTTASNWASFATGQETWASGTKSFAGGQNSLASGDVSFSFGTNTMAKSWNSIALGDSTIALEANSMSIGSKSMASGWTSFSAGNNTKATGTISFAIGNNTNATGGGSFASGNSTIASGNNSFSGGEQSKAIGNNAISLGYNTLAVGNNSFAIGYSTQAKSFCTLAIGMFNDLSGTNTDWSNGTDPAFVIGNGWDDSHRSNALTVLQNGKTAIGLILPTEMLDVNGNARFRSVKSGGGVSALYIDVNGVLTTSTSDESLKHNFVHITAALEKVKAMNGLYYSWKNDLQNNRRLGFIAQEMEKIVPEAVFTNPTDGLKGINYAELTAVLAEAIKEQQLQINSLSEVNKTLKAKADKIDLLQLQIDELRSLIDKKNDK